MSHVTNEAFGKRVGCHFTTASRLRNGDRLPSMDLFMNIVEAYGLKIDEAAKARRAGKAAFARYLRENVFETKAKQSDAA